MKRKWIILLISLLFLATIIGYVVKFLRTNDRPKIVVVLQDLDSQYWNIVKAGAEKGFRDFDIDGKVVAPGNQLKKDVLEYTLKNILNEHPDVLVVSPYESSAVISILEKFVENKIPVLLVDTDLPLEHKTAHIGTDNFRLGRIAGELLASQLQPGDEVALITRAVNSSVLSARIQGATSSLEDAGIKIAAEKSVVPHEDEALSIRKEMRMILQDHPDVKGVFATTDTMALDALDVIKEHGQKLPVIGADGITKMVELTKEGTLTGTVAQNPYDMGYISVETAWKVIKGIRVRKDVDTGVDLITKDNAKQKLDFLTELLK
ncbi:sugar ABC transporter substrate-binding protein [Bacillus sp. OTU530]|uniref:sugar ABC transporter substrate-binding protein n=1 Tax=Bacillus sp. OTU530 TaxID=3043862 RepID=UPI00313B8718